MSQIIAWELWVLTSKLLSYSLFMVFQTLCKEESDTGAKLIKMCVKDIKDKKFMTLPE